MDLSGVIVTWDALNSQKKNIEAVIKSNGDYYIPIKSNQGTFFNELQEYFDDECCSKIIAGNNESEYLTYIEKSHSSIIKYEIFQTSDINWYSNLKDWKKIQSFGLIKKTITKLIAKKDSSNKTKYKETTTCEKRFYISSRTVNVNEFNYVERNHWNIENKIHWQLDFTFNQDKNSTSNKNALKNLEIIHKFVLAIIERTKPKYNRSLRLIRKHLTNDFENFLPEFLCYLLLSSSTDFSQ